LSLVPAITLDYELLEASRTRWRDEVTRGFDNLALSLERMVGRDVGDVDRALTSFADASGAVSGNDGRPEALLSDAGLRAAGLSRELGPFEVIDATGNSLSIPPTPGIRNYTAAPFFRTLRSKQPDEVIVGFSPGVLPFTQPGLIVAKRLSQPDGSFAGAVVGMVPTDHLIEMLSSYDLGTNGYAAIVSTDGRIVASYPRLDEGPDHDFSKSAAYQYLLKNGPGVFDAPTPASSNSRRVYVVRRIPGLSIFILFSTPMASPYAAAGPLCGAIALLVTILAAAGMFGLLIRSELRRGRKVASPMPATVSPRESQLHAYLDHLAQGLFGLRYHPRSGYVFERANAEARRLLGLPDDVIGRRPPEVLSAKRWSEISLELERCRRDGTAVRKEFTTTFGGMPHTLRLTVNAVHDSPETGEVLLLGSIEDFTLEEAEQAEMRRHHHLEGVERLTSGIANEFNNLLQIITGHLELVRGENPQGQGHAKAAMDAATRGARLTSGLLSFTSKQMLRPEFVSLEPLFNTIRDSFEGPGSLGSNLVTEVDPGTPPVFADQGQLRLALLNLCFNAHESMLPQGGAVILRAFAADGGPATGQTAGPCVVFAVSDTGLGMSDEVAKQAREPFFTTKGARLRLGMGLPMADGFARQSGGELRLRSSDGKGTTAELWLPAAAAEPTPAAWHAKTEPNVLLVEDTPDLLELFADLLVQGGFRVKRASGPDEALVWLRGAERFDLLITDFAMAGMNGVQLIAMARDLQPGARALIVTGDTEEINLAGTPDRVGVLRKPFRADQLLRNARELTAEAQYTRA
jgi:signal transduction histidine kinase/CheY-like chemotaxis protein